MIKMNKNILQAARGHLFLKSVTGPGKADKGVLFIALSQFGLAFCFNVVMSFMPFYIIRISPYKTHETMIWIGLILGLNSFVAAVAAPFWGGLTSKYRPKSLYLRAFLCNGIIFLLMGFTSSLPMLLLLRLIQGALGGASTIGFFMISQVSAGERLQKNMSLFQNSMTAGQLAGPVVGAYAASLLGYRAPFILSFLLVGILLVLCNRFVADTGRGTKEKTRDTSTSRGLAWGWLLSFVATVHLTFLPSILPHILEGFHLFGEDALKSAGFIMMSYTATAITGNYVISHLGSAITLKTKIAAVCLLAACLQVLLYFSAGVLSFTVIRMLQTGVIAAVIPLVMANFAAEVSGAGLGFLNSARFAGNGCGPLLATSIMAYANLLTLYLTIAASTVGSVTAFLMTRRKKSV